MGGDGGRHVAGPLVEDQRARLGVSRAGHARATGLNREEMTMDYEISLREGLLALDAAAAKLRAVLTGRQHGIATIRELTAMEAKLGLIRQLTMDYRARLATDLHAINNMSFRQIGDMVGLSGNAVQLWRTERGPKFYVVIFRDTRRGRVTYVADREKPVRKNVRGRLGGGAVVVPSRYGLDLYGDEMTQDELAGWYRDLQGEAQFSVPDDLRLNDLRL